MNFKENLVKARGHFVFLGALFCGLGLVVTLENSSFASTDAQTQTEAETVDPLARFETVEPLPLAITGESSAEDLAHAKIAWTYFQNNTNPETGLANSADKYPSTTMWETGSYFIAVNAAEILGLIDKSEAQDRLRAALKTLATLRLYEDTLPNKAYHARTGELVDYANKPSADGLGWSALDIARVMSTLQLVQTRYPELNTDVAAVVASWDLDQMIKDGQLIGGNRIDGATRYDQEGRVGYEQYAAKAMMLFGFDAMRAADIDETVMIKDVQGQPIAVDKRLHRGKTPAFVVSEPYLFDGLEFGFDSRSHRLATAIYKAQEARFQTEGILTAVTETHIDQAPYFTYSSVWGGGADWAVLSFRGDRLDSKRTISTKAAFAWDALFGTDYTRQLVEAISPLGDPERGFPEGIYESGGQINGSVTANTNAVVLAALAFRARGPLHKVLK